MIEDDVEFVPYEHEILTMSPIERYAWNEPERPKYEPTEFEERTARDYEETLIPLWPA